MESWDDDLELQGNIFTNSQSTVKTSISSRLSIRSESESNAGDEDWSVPLAPNDEQSTSNAISSAKHAGIPLPSNVPSSALVGGSIKRLGNKKKSRRDLNHDWGDDLEMPDAGGDTLKLKVENHDQSSKKNNDLDEFDEWAEGSLGIRDAGTHRESKYRTSSTSAMSPSIGSCNTFESEEDGLDGLIIPTGPMDFENVLKKRKDEEFAERDHPVFKEQQEPKVQASTKHKDDDMDDLDFGPGDVFDPKRRALNRNVKTSWKTTNNTSSPASRAHTTLTFSDRPTHTKLPRPVSSTKPGTRLEPVFETGATATTRPRRNEATTTSAQLLRQKRSMPVLHSQRATATRQPPIPAMPANDIHGQPRQVRPTKSTAITHTRQHSDPNRSGSPIQRSVSRARQAYNTPETPTKARKDVAPASLAREAASKKQVTRPAKRRNFGDGTELDLFDDLPTSATKENRFTKQPSSRPQSTGMRHQISQSRLGLREKMSTPMPPPTPRSPGKGADNLPRFARDTAASRIAREQTLGVPSHKRSETSLASRTNWAAQIAARTPHSSPTANRQAKKGPQLINPMGKENSIRHCNELSFHASHISSQLPSSLATPVLGPEPDANHCSFSIVQDDAANKGMHWNSAHLRWEGNESVLASFNSNNERPTSIPTPVQGLTHHQSGPPPSPPRPALITNMAGAAQGVQVVGGMVFDPGRMCWLKMGRGGRRSSVAGGATSNESTSNPMSPSVGDDDDDDQEEDPFKGIEDLKDTGPPGMELDTPGPNKKAAGSDAVGASAGDWLVGEEFDLGPEFIRRQRDEEDVWRGRVAGWFAQGAEDENARGAALVMEENEGWKWKIREIAGAAGEF